MIKAISMLGNAEKPGSLSNVAGKPQVETAPKVETAPVKDTFVPSSEKKEEPVKADPNDKFEKKEEKTEEAK